MAYWHVVVSQLVQDSALATAFLYILIKHIV